MLLACSIVFPQMPLAEITESVTAAQAPSKSQVSTARTALDIGLAFYRRACNARDHRTQEKHVRYLTWDSSPQFGRDYEITLVREVKVSALHCMMDAFYAVCESPDGVQSSQNLSTIRERMEVGCSASTTSFQMRAIAYGVLCVKFLPMILGSSQETPPRTQTIMPPDSCAQRVMKSDLKCAEPN